MPRRSEFRPPALVPGDARIVSKTANGRGCRYEVQYAGREETTWLTGTQAKRQLPDQVAAFEAAQTETEEEEREEEDEEDGEQEMDEDAEEGSNTDVSASRMHKLERLVQIQQQHNEQLQKRIEQLQAVSAGSSQPTAARSSTSSSSVFGKPRAQDLREYDGASGIQLDEWLAELRLTTRLHRLSPLDTVSFGVSRLRGAALLWWQAMSDAEQDTYTSLDMLSAALRKRFQPITTARVARTQLHALRQGMRHINDYIADFQRISAQIGTELSTHEAMYAFEQGLRTDLAEKLRIEGVTTLQAAIETVARIGGLTAAATHGAQQRGGVAGRVHQMEYRSDDIPLDAQVAQLQTQLNAMLAQQAQHNTAHDGRASFSVGPHTHPQRTGGFSGRGRGRVGRWGGERRERPLPTIPGVSAAEVRRRWDARVCVRCGEAGHRGLECGNAISAQPKN